jgi:hypothetical protein
MNEKLSFQELYDVVDLYIDVFFTDISLHLNDFNTKLQGFGITIDIMFYNIKAFEIKLEIFKRNVDNDTFK